MLISKNKRSIYKLFRESSFIFLWSPPGHGIIHPRRSSSRNFEDLQNLADFFFSSLSIHLQDSSQCCLLFTLYLIRVPCKYFVTELLSGFFTKSVRLPFIVILTSILVAVLPVGLSLMLRIQERNETKYPNSNPALASRRANSRSPVPSTPTSSTTSRQ